MKSTPIQSENVPRVSVVTSLARARVVLLFSLAAAGTLFGRAWQHLRWDAPFRALLWDENLLSGLLATLGVTWSEWVSSPAVETAIQGTIRGFGGFYLVAGIVALSARRFSASAPIDPPARPAKRVNPFIRWSLGLATAALALLALLYWKDKAYQIGQLIEYSLQVGAPLFLLWSLRGLSDREWWLIRLAIALTFVGHGLYAVGFHPRPGVFLQMTMSGLGLDQEGATTLLLLAGWLDFAAAALILLPQRSLVRAGLYYCFGWGLLTTLARIWSNYDLYGWESLLDRWVWESLYRLPHFLVPLAVLLGWKRVN